MTDPIAITPGTFEGWEAEINTMMDRHIEACKATFQAYGADATRVMKAVQASELSEPKQAALAILFIQRSEEFAKIIETSLDA